MAPSIQQGLKTVGKKKIFFTFYTAKRATGGSVPGFGRGLSQALVF